MRLTKNQQAALRCLPEAGRFDVPPRNQGQIVLVSYACSADYIYERAYDQSDRTVTITAYQHPRHECDFYPLHVMLEQHLSALLAAQRKRAEAQENAASSDMRCMTSTPEPC